MEHKETDTLEDRRTDRHKNINQVCKKHFKNYIMYMERQQIFYPNTFLRKPIMFYS